MNDDVTELIRELDAQDVKLRELEATIAAVRRVLEDCPTVDGFIEVDRVLLALEQDPA